MIMQLHHLVAYALDWLFELTDTWPTVLVHSSIALPIGIFAILIYRYATNQKALEHTASQMHANLIGIKLYSHSLANVMRCQAGLLKFACLRTWYALPALLLMVVPLILLFVHLESRYIYRPFATEEPIVLSVHFDSQSYDPAAIELQTSPNLNVQSLPLHDVSLRTIYWRLSAKQTGTHVASILIGDHKWTKQITSADRGRLEPVCTERATGSIWASIITPTEGPIASNSEIEAIKTYYPSRESGASAFGLPWWLSILIQSCLFAWLFAKILGVNL